MTTLAITYLQWGQIANDYRIYYFHHLVGCFYAAYQQMSNMFVLTVHGMTHTGCNFKHEYLRSHVLINVCRFHHHQQQH